MSFSEQAANGKPVKPKKVLLFNFNGKLFGHSDQGWVLDLMELGGYSHCESLLGIRWHAGL